MANKLPPLLDFECAAYPFESDAILLTSFADIPVASEGKKAATAPHLNISPSHFLALRSVNIIALNAIILLQLVSAISTLARACVHDSS